MSGLIPQVKYFAGAKVLFLPGGGCLSVYSGGAFSVAALGQVVDHLGVAWAGESSYVAYCGHADVQFDWEAVAHNTKIRTSLGQAACSVVVRPSELASADRFCRRLTAAGVPRMAFTTGEEVQARQWALRAGVLVSARLCSRGSIRV